MKTLTLLALLLMGPSVPAGAADAPPHPDSPGNVAILVFDGVQIIDYSGPYEVFGQAGYRTFTVAAKPGPLVTAMEQKIVPAHTLADAPPIDVLVIPGGNVGPSVDDPAVIAWIREQAPSVRHILTVCNGAFILAKTGLLDGLTATTFFPMIPELQKAAPKARVVSDQRFVDNGKIITSAGLSSGIDGALHVVEVLQGKGRAQQIALGMEYRWHPDEGFARGALADAPLRRLFRSQRLELGELRLLQTEGSRERWDEQWELKTAASLAEVRTQVERYFTEAGKWSPQDAAGGGPRRWRFAGEDQKSWNATVDVQPAAEGTYRLAIHLERAGA